MPEIKESRYWNTVCAMAEKQRRKGHATYGKGLEENRADMITRIEYLQEELIDALMYCEWMKEHIRSASGSIDFDYTAEDE